jgi:hypothetical protein
MCLILQIKTLEGKGRGVVTTQPFKMGELLCEYAGELITKEEEKQREVEYSKKPFHWMLSAVFHSQIREFLVSFWSRLHNIEQSALNPCV